MTVIDAEITVTFNSCHLITQDDLDNWGGKGDGITLKEYVQFMLDENMLLDMFDMGDGKIKLVNVKSI